MDENEIMQRIWSILPDGRENAIRFIELERRTGISVRDLHKIENKMRRSGYGFGASRGRCAGAWRCRTREELDECVRTLRAQANDMLETAAAMEQIDLDE